MNKVETAIVDLQSYADASWGGLNETFELAIIALREKSERSNGCAYASDIKTLALQVDELPDDEFYYFFAKLSENRGFDLDVCAERVGFLAWLKQVLDEIVWPKEAS